MIDSLYIGASGLHTQQTYLNLISNNVANLNTPGFKKDRISFTDLVQRHAELSPAQGLVRNASVGYGTAVTGTEKVFQMGAIKKTGREMDVAIQGSGFLEVMLPDSRTAYTRAGALSVNQDGLLATAEGYRLSSEIQVPVDTTALLVRTNGEVFAQVSGESEPLLLGQIELASFNNPSGLEAIGEKLYSATDRSGEAYFGIPGESGLGTLGQGSLEASNVDLVEELTDLMVAQRAYQVSARIIQASDQMLSITNDLRP